MAEVLLLDDQLEPIGSPISAADSVIGVSDRSIIIVGPDSVREYDLTGTLQRTAGNVDVPHDPENVMIAAMDHGDSVFTDWTEEESDRCGAFGFAGTEICVRWSGQTCGNPFWYGDYDLDYTEDGPGPPQANLLACTHRRRRQTVPARY